MRKSAKILTAVAVAGLTFAGGSAFTASNTQASAATVGYGTTTVSGATVNSLKYNLDQSGANITSVALILEGDTTTSKVAMNFNAGTSFDCSTTDVAGVATTTYSCTPAAPLSTDSLTSTAVIVN